jgi:radical SAM protein with 4Fe4S-binding SPASM domain
MTKKFVKTLNFSLKRKAKIIDEKINFYKNIPILSWIEISPIDACNRKCTFCPKSDPEIAPDTYKTLNLEIVQKLNKELGEINFNGTIVFAGYGEPLLNKNIYGMINILGANFNTEVTTNGDPLNIKTLIKLKESKLKKLVISLYDGPEQINFFKKLLKEVGFEKDRYVLRDRWYDKKEGYGLMLTNRAGTLSLKNKNLPANLSKKCFYTHYSVMIDWDGSVYLCTQDWNRKVSSGNLAREHLIEIWNSQILKNYREKLEKGDRSIDPCKNCNANGTLHGFKHAEAWKKYYLKN